MSKRRKKCEPPVATKFQVEDRVRVKHGVMDTEYPDIPLGGWAGTISKIHHDGMYSVRWSRETLATIHPVYRKRCERDGMVLEEYWLGDDDLEADPGGPLAIEQPGEITPRPLSAKDQDDRVRMAFGLTSDDLLPRPDDESLETYYDYLAAKLSFPFQARCHEDDSFFDPSPAPRVTVVALGSKPEDLDEDEGILCEVETAEGEDLVPLTNLELRRSDPNRQLIDDYAAWFAGEMIYEDGEGDSDDEEEFGNDDELDDEEFSGVLEEASWRSVTLLLFEIAAFATSYGAVVGSAVAVMPWAKWGACIGGGLWGILVAVAHAASAHKDMRPVVPRLRKGLGGIVGLIIGAVQGAFFGIMAVAFIGAALGSIVGFVLRRLVRGKRWLILRVFPEGMLFAAACGVAAQAFYMDHARATEGLLYGAAAGLAGGLFVCLVTLPLAVLTVRRL